MRRWTKNNTALDEHLSKRSITASTYRALTRLRLRWLSALLARNVNGCQCEFLNTSRNDTTISYAPTINCTCSSKGSTRVDTYGTHNVFGLCSKNNRPICRRIRKHHHVSSYFDSPGLSTMLTQKKSLPVAHVKVGRHCETKSNRKCKNCLVSTKQQRMSIQQ